MNLTLDLPFPDKHLLPNKARTMHYRARAEYAKMYRMIGRVETLNALKWDYKPSAASHAVTLTFSEPDKRARDLDGMLSACKPLLDGIADALELNDHCFEPITIQRGERVKGGCVKIEIKDGTLDF